MEAITIMAPTNASQDPVLRALLTDRTTNDLDHSETPDIGLGLLGARGVTVLLLAQALLFVTLVGGARIAVAEALGPWCREADFQCKLTGQVWDRHGS